MEKDKILETLLGSLLMLKTGFSLKSILSLATAALGFLFSANLMIIAALLIFILFDFVTGVMKAIHTETFSSAGLKHGFGKIIVYAIVIVLAHQFTNVHPILSWLEYAIYSYIALTEYESIVENINVFGYKLPSITRLKKALEKLKQPNE